MAQDHCNSLLHVMYTCRLSASAHHTKAAESAYRLPSSTTTVAIYYYYAHES